MARHRSIHASTTSALRVRFHRIATLPAVAAGGPPRARIIARRTSQTIGRRLGGSRRLEPVNDRSNQPDGIARRRRLAILAEGNFGFHHGKTAVGVIRYGPDDVRAVIDSTQAGRNVSTILPGRDIPIVASLDEALARDPRPDTLLIGIAPTGGKLPDSWRASNETSMS